jgi:hypothetical protein
MAIRPWTLNPQGEQPTLLLLQILRTPGSRSMTSVRRRRENKDLLCDLLLWHSELQFGIAQRTVESPQLWVRVELSNPLALCPRVALHSRAWSPCWLMRLALLHCIDKLWTFTPQWSTIVSGN